jgi:glycoside/pentoside/hexuronide:cation symporter, GPH family
MDNKSDRISFFQKSAYGSGACAECIMANIMIILALPIYNIGLGVKASAISLAIALPKIWDAFSDPIMGNISDNTRSRFGRRRPYILLGSILTGVLCYFMWTPPANLPENMLVWYFGIVVTLFYTSYTVFFVPYNAMGLEMSSNYDERTSIMSFRAFFLYFNGLVFMPFIYKSCFWFGERFPIEGVKPEVAGVRYTGIVFGIIIAVVGSIPAIFCKERYAEIKQESVPFLKAVKETLSNKAFLILCGMMFTLLTGAMIAVSFMTYIGISHIFNGDRSLNATYVTYSFIIGGISGMIGAFFVNRYGKKFGKKKILITSIVVNIFLCMGSWFYLTPRYPFLLLTYALVIAPCQAALWTFMYSMAADVCDLDELKTGKRREGSYGAVFSFIMKLSAAGIIATTGFMIDLSGFDPNLTIQTEDSILRMRLFFAFVPVVFLLIGLILTIKFPITKEKLQEVQLQIAQRKNQEQIQD